MRNGDCQTRWDRETEEVQTDKVEQLDELKTLKPLQEEDARSSPEKFYIYNTGE
ncbi:unnamed protein product [Anisakis simplex]|uniref:Uncharacterized protein n=1 Tax=Anisakis simplex TaxID=6269 RepID=A0A0M3JFK1_ANISI|nr:unnamed protein product [Anisakis simplex]